MTPQPGGALPVVSMRGIHKWFGPTHAVNDVSLDVRPGEVLGVVGTNGAGKSTLINILSGVHQASEGTIEIDGSPANLDDPFRASRAGIQTVHQNIDNGVVPGMTVAENLALDRLADPSAPMWTSPRATRERARLIEDAIGLDLPLDAPVEELLSSQRQQLIIARALSRKPRLLILDEPTSTLSRPEVEALFSVVRRLAASGVAVMYISHYLYEIEELCDRVAVLRDGRLEGVFQRKFTRTEIVEAMLGELTTAARSESDSRPGEVVLDLQGVRAWPGGDAIDLQLRKGEVLGLTGLIAAGKTEILHQVYGVRPLVDGAMRLLGKPYVPRNPSQAVEAGVALVPEERGRQAIIPQWSVTWNITLPFLKRYSGPLGLMVGTRERSVTQSLARRMSLVYGGPNALIESLSGGNQQKVSVARWLQVPTNVLMLDEPFRGIDIGARRDIALELHDVAKSCAVLVASSDPEEILEVSDRVVVIAEGRIVGELTAAAATTRTLARMMSGADQ